MGITHYFPAPFISLVWGQWFKREEPVICMEIYKGRGSSSLHESKRFLGCWTWILNTARGVALEKCHLTAPLLPLEIMLLLGWWNWKQGGGLKISSRRSELVEIPVFSPQAEKAMLFLCWQNNPRVQAHILRAGHFRAQSGIVRHRMQRATSPYLVLAHF